jgi:tRNA-2-methylthio-N6-dimethylallyladenosine synthase
VPYVRGREVSRPIDEVLDEIAKKVEQGGNEIILLGQNVNSYKPGLANLLRQIALRITHYELRVPRIQFLTSHPRDMSDAIIKAVAELPYVAKEFMMPLQSGDDEILKKMNRGYTLSHYLGRVSKIRELLPSARISTDILVGFPGETEEQFLKTLQAVEVIGFNEVHMFAYSSRPGTLAAGMPDQLSEGIKQERLQRLIKTVRALLS